jgi:hypothetical protein
LEVCASIGGFDPNTKAKINAIVPAIRMVLLLALLLFPCFPIFNKFGAKSTALLADKNRIRWRLPEHDSHRVRTAEISYTQLVCLPILFKQTWLQTVLHAPNFSIV